jgi:hypothetical protein
MPLIATRGAASVQGFGEFAQSAIPNYIEDVFSTWLYNGNGSTQTITNNIDLSTKGGMVWSKARNLTGNNVVCDTVRGATKAIFTNLTNATITSADYVDAFTTTGYSIGSDSDINNASKTYVSWTFREQAKFFDVVTYSGNSVSGRLIPQSLGSAPGCIIVKCTNLAGTNWAVWHRSLATGYNLQLQSTNAAFNTKPQWFNSSTQGSSTTFEVGNDTDTNETGNTYVAYLFAHNAGGFGLTGTDNVISCGSFNYNTDPQTVTIGYEPQWLMVKRSDGVGDWIMFDNMRGFTANAGGGAGKRLLANTSGAETANDGLYYGGATGFNLNLPAYGNYIYIAIRRGPMKVPTTGTSVYYAEAQQDTNTTITTNFPVDLAIDRYQYQNVSQTNQTGTPWVYDRLRGTNAILQTNSTSAEVAAGSGPSFYVSTTGFQSNTKLNIGPGDGSLGNDYAFFWNFRRAPSFFDEVCFTQTTTSGAQAIAHNLTVAPELVIVKPRSQASSSWEVFPVALNNRLNLNATTAASTYAPLSSVTTTSFSYPMADLGWSIGVTYVAYLFATCPGVSKVGSYTGNGTTQTINCGFGAGGARFVLIKRTDSTGDWYVYDTARGMTVLTDPYLRLNSTAAQTATLGSVTTVSTGFALNASVLAAINTNAASYIFLAIA